MKGYNYFLDTNVFLRMVVKDDSAKVTECENLIRAISRKELRAFTSTIVLAELVWTSLGFYQLSKKEVVKILRGILGIKNLKIRDQLDPSLAVENYERYGVKFIDALIASHTAIVKGQAKIVSYDRDFDKLPVVRVEPGKLLRNSKS